MVGDVLETHEHMSSSSLSYHKDGETRKALDGARVPPDSATAT